jgi:hypothetical protein
MHKFLANDYFKRFQHFRFNPYQLILILWLLNCVQNENQFKYLDQCGYLIELSTLSNDAVAYESIITFLNTK